MHLPLFKNRTSARNIAFAILMFIYSLPTNGQTFNWALQTGSNFSSIPVGAAEVHTDQEGNVYVVGFSEDSVDFDPSLNTALLIPMDTVGPSVPWCFLAKYDATGKYLWAKCIGSSFTNAAPGVVVDGKGNVSVYIAGVVHYRTKSGIERVKEVTANRMHCYIAQYNKDGHFLWSNFLRNIFTVYTEIGEDTRNGFISPSELRFDFDGNLYLAGNYRSDSVVDFDEGAGTAQLASDGTTVNGFVAKYDTTGKCVWARGWNGIRNGSDVLSAFVAVDGALGDVYLSGTFFGSVDFNPGPEMDTLKSLGIYDIYILKLDKSGNFKWAKRIGGSNVDMCQGITLGGLGNIFITGYIVSQKVDFDPGPDTATVVINGIADMFIARYDADGNYSWAKAVGGSGSIMMGNGIKADKYDNVYINGLLGYGPVDFDPGSDSAILTPSIYDVFIAKYDACGNYVWAGNIGAADVAYDGIAPGGIFVEPTDDHSFNVYTTGTFINTRDFNTGLDTFEMTSRNNFDYYLLKMNFSDTPKTLSYLTVATCDKEYRLNDSVYTRSGTYMQLLPLAGDCDSIIELDLVLHTIEKPVIQVSNKSLSVTGNYISYQWLKNRVPVSGANLSSYNVTDNGDYQVAVSSANGCMDTSEVFIVNNTGLHTFDRDVVQVFPNPAKDRVYISAATPVSVRITDMEGRLIRNENAVRSVSVGDLSEGMYLLYIMDTNGVLHGVEKIIKTH